MALNLLIFILKMTIYLIGPSGVGKTTCARGAAEALPVVHLDLDSLCRGNEYNWSVCRQEFTKAEYAPHDRIQIVDIGAGTQTLPELRTYLSQRRERVVLIWAPESEVIQRNPLGPDRLLEEYRQTEYASREDLYRIARQRVDVAQLAEHESVQVFVDDLVQIFVRQWATKAA